MLGPGFFGFRKPPGLRPDPARGLVSRPTYLSSQNSVIAHRKMFIVPKIEEI